MVGLVNICLQLTFGHRLNYSLQEFFFANAKCFVTPLECSFVQKKFLVKEMFDPGIIL